MTQVPATSHGSAGPLSITTAITAAQLLADTVAGVAVTSAPPAGQMFVPQAMLFVLHFGTKPYAPSTEDLYISTVAEWTGPNGGAWGVAGKSGFLSLPRNSAVGLRVVDDVSLAGVNGQPLALLTNGSLAKGPISTTTLNAGGAGYAPGDTGNIDGGLASATYVVDTVGGGGAVLTYHLTDPGATYAVANAVTTTATSGAGAGFKVNITAVDHGDGTLTVTTYYALADAT